MAAISIQRTRAMDIQAAGASSLLQISVERPLLSQSMVARSAVQQTTKWQANSFGYLGVGQKSRQASEPARQPESADALMLPARTPALTSQSLQQVAEGLTHWTNVEMKHQSRDGLVFDGQVIHYITWKW